MSAFRVGACNRNRGSQKMKNKKKHVNSINVQYREQTVCSKCCVNAENKNAYEQLLKESSLFGSQ